MGNRSIEEMRERFEIIEETANDAILTIDEAGKILSASRAGERIFGHQVEELIGKRADTLIRDYAGHVRQARTGARVLEAVGLHKSGRKIQIELSLGEYNKDNKQIITGIIRDIATRKDTDRRLAAHFAVTRALAESASLSEAAPKLLQYIARAVGWELGELWCANADSETLHIESSWHEPAYQVEEFERASRKTILLPGIDLVGRVFSSGQPAWIENVVQDSNFPRGPIAARVGLQGAFAFPVHAGGSVPCVIAFYTRDVVEPDSEMLEMFDALGRQIGDFIKRARLEEERDKLLICERVARSQAEAHAEKLAFLGQAATLMASSLDHHTNLMTLASLAVHRLADWCTVDVVREDQSFHRVAFVHRDPVRMERARDLEQGFALPASAPPGVAHVVRTGKAMIYADVPDSMLVAFAYDVEHLKILQELGLASAMVVPLAARGRALGAITFSSENADRRYTPEDLSLAEELAARAALNIDNARLHGEAQKELVQVQAKAGEIQTLNAELEQRVRERTVQLEMAARELKAFTYAISHDMRGPLRAIDGFSRVLMEEYSHKVDAEGKRLLNIVRDNATNMGQQIEGLLALSHFGRQPLDQTDIDMKALVQNVFDEIQSTEQRPEVVLELHQLPPAFADRAMTRKVFHGLISNAFKFTRPRPNATVEIGHQDCGAQNTYYVRDNGVGFDMEYRDKLFGVFQHLHSSDEFEGIGAGLALVQRIILRHGGRVWAEGKVGEGAAFYFTLPGA